MARRHQVVTINHVAADAGVSLQTVSRVINNAPNVRPEMQARVQASIDKLGYVPSIAAQRMSGSRSYIILAINDRERTIAEWQAREGSDWVDQMLLGGMLKCAEFGYRMIFELLDTHNDHVERELSATIAALQPDGVILTPPHSGNPLITNLLEQRKIPFARIGTDTIGAGFAITMDDAGSARSATEHLLELGHRKIGFIAGSKEYNLADARISGWSHAMADAGLPIDGLCMRGGSTHQSGKVAAAALLDFEERPSAIIASNDQMALATLDVANELQLTVPKDLSLLCFDNTPIVRYTSPPLTVIDQPIAATFSQAVDLLINHVHTSTSAAFIVPGKLIFRESTSAPTRR